MGFITFLQLYQLILLDCLMAWGMMGVLVVPGGHQLDIGGGY